MPSSLRKTNEEKKNREEQKEEQKKKRCVEEQEEKAWEDQIWIGSELCKEEEQKNWKRRRGKKENVTEIEIERKGDRVQRSHRKWRYRRRLKKKQKVLVEKEKNNLTRGNTDGGKKKRPD